MNAKRLAQNVFCGWWSLPRRFPRALLGAIGDAVKASEQHHAGEIVFAVQSRLPWLDVVRGLEPRQQARALFARLGVWDTDANSGVLIYVLLSERRIEIVPDRGIAARVDAAAWRAVAEAIRERFIDGDWRGGSLAGIAAVDAILRQHFPLAGGRNADELGDDPVIV